MKKTIFEGMATAIVTPMTRDGIDRDYAKRRIAAQKSAEWFRERCDFCLENNGTQADFQETCLAFLRKLGIMKTN